MEYIVFVSETWENLQKPKENVAKRSKTYKNLRKTKIFPSLKSRGSSSAHCPLGGPSVHCQRWERNMQRPNFELPPS